MGQFMDSTKSKTDIKQFEPLTVMGIFWMTFGGIVLVATFFISDNSHVPLVMLRITNIVAGAIILIAGITCLFKARTKRKKAAES